MRSATFSIARPAGSDSFSSLRKGAEFLDERFLEPVYLGYVRATIQSIGMCDLQVKMPGMEKFANIRTVAGHAVFGDIIVLQPYQSLSRCTADRSYY